MFQTKRQEVQSPQPNGIGWCQKQEEDPGGWTLANKVRQGKKEGEEWALGSMKGPLDRGPLRGTADTAEHLL